MLINNKRHQALLFIFLTIIGVMVLGISLPELRFQPGLPVPGANTDSPTGQTIQPGSETSSLEFPWFLQFGLAAGILLLFFALVTALFKKANFKKIVSLTCGLAVLFLMFSQLSQLATNQLDLLPAESDISPQPPAQYSTAPIGDPPSGLFWVAAILLFAGLVLTGWLLSRTFRRSRKEDPLAVEAEAAVQAIADGQGLSDVIIRCYLNMEDIIAQERGIERGQSVTPREFEASLVEKGIPKNPILELTTLFEKARYGNRSLNKQDEQEAVNCFIAIQKACRLDSGRIR